MCLQYKQKKELKLCIKQLTLNFINISLSQLLHSIISSIIIIVIRFLKSTAQRPGNYFLILEQSMTNALRMGSDYMRSGMSISFLPRIGTCKFIASLWENKTSNEAGPKWDPNPRILHLFFFLKPQLCVPLTKCRL